MRELSSMEMGAVSGGDAAGAAGAVVGAVCGFFAKKLGGAVGCAIAGEATTDLLNAAGDWGGVDNPPGGGDYGNPGNKNG